ncbi:MAG: FAD-binding oxidoreductase, partial [Planctomycetes bacterium]|nr:FAD-binding oxidoreductase [Planctomycetota bacterium]
MSDYTATQLAAALHRLSTRIDGDVLQEEIERKLYSSDASVYQQMPVAVVRPRHVKDLQVAVAWAAENSIALIPRAGGTSLAGQVVGDGVVLDVSRYLHKYGVYNIEEKWIDLEVGIIQDDLNDRVAVDGLTFGPDTSTSNRCMIGGMIGNNACGEHSLIHGTTRDHVLSMDVILSDGSTAIFTALNAEELEVKKSLDNLEGRIYREVFDLIENNRELIEKSFPKKHIIRRNTAYALDYLANSQPWNSDGPVFNLSPLICGSEGTLCMVSSARLNLEHLPKRKIVCCAHFDTVVDACRANIIALKHNPSAVELMDDNILEATKENLLQKHNRFWVEGDPGAVLPIEFFGENDQELEQRCTDLIKDLKDADLGYAFPIVKHEQAKHVWDLRRAGLGLLMGIPGDKKSLPLLEDAAVAVEDLPAYVEGVQEIMDKHALNIVYYAHASVGLLHIRPQIDIKQQSQVELFEQIGHEVFELVQSFGGSISGEHGDGRLRAPFIQKVFGDECYQLFHDVKNIFDPQDIFNPHKIVNPLPMSSDLRFEKDYQTPAMKTWFDWSHDQGLVRATEKCNGAGACRKSPGRGTMCPS